MLRNEVGSDEMCGELPTITTAGVDGVINTFGVMQLDTHTHTGSRFMRSNFAAFEHFQQTDQVSCHRKTGKFRALNEKSSNRPVKKLLLVSADRIRRNFNFPNLLDEDIIISPIRWFEHISHDSFHNGNSEDINTSMISSRNSRISNPRNSETHNLNEIDVDPLEEAEEELPSL